MQQPAVQQPITTAPCACPFCDSGAIKTLSKVVTAEIYWRCLRCGEIWNESRLKKANPRGLRHGR